MKEHRASSWCNSAWRDARRILCRQGRTTGVVWRWMRKSYSCSCLVFCSWGVSYNVEAWFVCVCVCVWEREREREREREGERKIRVWWSLSFAGCLPGVCTLFCNKFIWESPYLIWCSFCLECASMAFSVLHLAVQFFGMHILLVSHGHYHTLSFSM